MNDREIDQLAQELLDIQLGSAEDAKALLDSSFDYRDRARIADAIDRIYRESLPTFTNDQDDR